MTHWARLRARCLPVLLVSASVLAPAGVVADKKADRKKAEEEYKNINPAAPYRLFVAASPSQDGAKKLLSIFEPKNATKKWRPFYDTWFAVVPTRDEAEIIIDVDNKGADFTPGYKPLYYMTGKVTVVGLVRDLPIRGDDNNPPLFGDSWEHFDMLGRLVRFMRDTHKEAVLAHGAQPASVSPASPPPVPVPAAQAAPAVAPRSEPAAEEVYFVVTGPAGAYHYHREGCTLLKLGAQRIRASDLGDRQPCAVCKPTPPSKRRE